MKRVSRNRVQRGSRASLAVALVVAFAPMRLHAQEVQSTLLEERVKRIEKLVNSQALIETVQRLEQLQSELRQLRGDVEQQGYELEGIKRRQRELYLDIDRRLEQLGTGSSESMSQPPSAPSSAPLGETTSEPDESDGAQGLPVDAETEQRSYEDAFVLLQDGQYPQAIEAFQTFLSTYPQGQYAGNAQYWLGEANYVTRNFGVALKQFAQVMERYPQSPKILDAMLKIGYAHYELREWEKAREVLSDLVTRYPKSTAANLATQRLQRMKQEGH
jgi:tol-pal system protein YbgF